MLQTICMSPELLVNQNMSESEICGYSPGQGSPLPGETASPKSSFQQSPSLPDSGLTELNSASPKIYHPPPPPCKPPGMPAPADSELSSDPSQKRYMGVRVKMPVRELLRKIRLSKGLDPAPSKEASSVKTVTKGSSGKTAEKRRTHPYTEKQLRQGKQSAGQSPKGLEDLDILVEVLQEDLNKSQLGEERRHPAPGAFGQGFSREPRSCRWEGEEAAGALRGSWAELPPEPCCGDFPPSPRAQAEPRCPGQRESGQSRGWPGMSGRQDALPSSQQGCPRNSPSQGGFPRITSSQESFLRNSSSQEGFPRISSSQEGFLRNSPSQGGFPRITSSQEGFLRNPPSQEGFPRNPPSQEGFPRISSSQEGFPRTSPSQESFLRTSPSQESFLRTSPSQESFLRTSPSQESFLRTSPSQEGFLRTSPSQEGFLRTSPSQEGFLRTSPSQEGFLRNSPSQEGFPRISSSQEGFLRNSPSQEGFLRNSPSQEGFLRNSLSQQGFLRNSPSQQGFLRNSPSQQGFLRNSAPQQGFPRNSAPQAMPAVPSPAGSLLEAHGGSPDVGGRLRLTQIPSTQQDLSALSFFQFQLHRVENLLRNIPEEKLLAPDENGNRLLHKAVAQGRRALTFALAQRFASLNKIDEKDAEERTALHLAAEKNQHLMVSDLISLGANVNEQDSSGKTPLHLCAENGYLRVLQVLKSCKDSGVCVEVDLPDHCGLTPLHRAALAHTVLLREWQSSARGTGSFLRLRREQILEGILCLLQMGAKPQLQVLNSHQTSTACLKLQENTELLCLLQAHKPQAQDVLQESCSLLDAPPVADNSPELCSWPSSELLDVLLRAWPGINGETQLQNEECQSGMHCKGKEQSLPVCPAGFFCPGGNPTVEPVPCPPGTFRSEALPSHSCLPCPVHFFSPRPGQKSCFPCGSEAEQPAEGQHTCVCLGRGQVFQPRDALCTCPPGFGRDGRDGRSCIPKSAPACRAPASRSQEGLCLSPAAWAGYCSRQVCADPKDFQGYDKVLGLCICRSDSLEEICNFGCRRHQKSTLQLTCAGGKAQLLITHSNGSKTAVFLEGLRKVLPKPNFSLEDVCAAGGQTHPAHIVEMSEKGFLGVYNPDPQLIHELLVLNEAPSLHEMSLPPAHAGPEGCRDQSLNPPNPKSQPQFQSIPNPTSLDQNPPNPLNSTPQPEFQGTQNHTSQDLNPPNSTSQPEFLDQNPPTPHPTFQGIPNPTSLDQNPSNPKSQPEFLDQNPPASQPEFHSIPNLTSMDQNPPTPSNSTSQPEFLDQNPLNSPSRPKFQGIPNPTSLDLNPSNPKSQPEFLDQNPLNSPSSPRFQGIPNPTSLDQNPPNPPNSTSHPKFLDQNPPTPHPTFQGVPNPTSLDQNPSNPKSQPEFLDQNPPTSQPEFHSIPNPTSLDQNPSNPKSQLEFLDQNPLNSPSYPRFQGIPNPTSLDQNPPNPPNSTSHPEFLDQNPPTPHPTFQGKPNPTSLDLNPPNPPNSTPHPKFRGILNPSACLGSASLLFLLSPQHFPVYDVNNLYNTNAEFDWGDFRSLEEEIREIPRNSQDLLLFLFHFQAPGTYVLHLSSNKHKRMYVRVMPAGGQCRQDGPFFPSTPRALVQLGLAQLSPAQGKELLHPEPMLSAAAATALLLLLLLPLLCRGQRRSRPSPAFRRRQLRHRAHIPGSGRESAHPAPRSREAAAGTAWEPEGQIDLDSFNTKVFFELLLRQAQAVTSTLGHLKEEVKVVYHRVLSEISSLKNLWIKALSIPGEGEDAEMAKEQVPSSGSFETPEISRFYGISGVSSHPWELIPQKLIPLLQAVLQLLEEHRKNNFSPETPGSTLKASAARTEGLKSEENHKPTPPAAMNSPSPAGRITHTQREMQTSLELDTASALSPAELEEKVDALTEELLQVLQEEQQFLSTQGNEDLLSYYLEITSLEKESLVQQIDALEEEIAQGRKL